MKFKGALNTTSTDVDEIIKVDALWSDPGENDGLSVSYRGDGLLRFGNNLTHQFLQNNNLELIIRSHEVPEDLNGYFWQHNKKLLTLFSASN